MDQANLDLKIQACITQEKELQFRTFTNQDALTIGLTLIDHAAKAGQAITIDIERHDQQLFHYAMSGTNLDNDYWVMRKKNVVKRFHISSMHAGYLLQRSGMTITERYHLDPTQYAAHGGSFPLIIEEVRVVGAITVSGLPQEDDHALVVKVLREHLKKSG